MDCVFYLISLLFLPVIWLWGGSVEKKHLEELAAREAQVKDILLSTLEEPEADVSVLPPKVVSGEAVISSDYFKSWLWGFRNFFGGESTTFSVLVERARREALLRMVEAAKREGYTAICNVRFDSVDLAGSATNANGQSRMIMATMTVSGTAYMKK